ncbi:MAG TPA: OmpA family protein [Candidatus Eisenbacteria bacterium]|nr:OmpA family protein [Candidatus Eisenbacteria bacterium]
MVSSSTRAALPPAAILLTLVALVAGNIPKAHAVEERVWATVEAGVNAYDAEQAFKDGVGLGVRGGYFLNRWFGVEGLFTSSSPTLEQPYSGSGSFTHFGGGIIVTPDRYKWVLPYIYAGLGSASADHESTSTSAGAFHGGGGVLVRAGERLGFRLDARDVSYKQEGGPGRETRVNSLYFSGGVTALWGGRPRDTDEDGVPDKNDTSPETPRGAVVSATGVPLDGDGDGVFDGLDKDPATPKGAKVDALGIAIDTDKDGVPDGIDQCADTAQGVVVDATGCGVDTDGDKIFDGLDKCADTPRGAVVDSIGCPLDADGDGIPDGIDICPFTPSGVAVNAGGCPIAPTPTERTMLQDWLIRFTAFPFAPDSATFSPEGAARLDSVGVMLLQWPMLKVEIGVHCDDTPEPGFRVPLTGLRARAILRYLLAKYPKLNQKQIWITGYGDTDPIAPNTSTAGRLQNNRVEIKILNMNVLSEERARRASFGSTPAPPAPGLEPRMPETPKE